jgi:hypothetical protein
VGLFRILASPGLGLPLAGLELDAGNRLFHEGGCFFVHAAKVRPITTAAPPATVIRHCSRQHLQKEIVAIQPRAVVFLGENNARPAFEELFGQSGGDISTVSCNGWSGKGVVAPQPRRQWAEETAAILRRVWAMREHPRN